MGFIYKITSPTGRIYVGQTRNIIQRQANYRCFRHRSKKSIIIWSIKKHGWDKHKFEVIEEVDNCIMDDREIYWIKELKTFYPENIHGMNLTKGGGGVSQPWKHDIERVAKAKLRCGKNAPTYGRIISDVERKKIADGVSKYNIANNVRPPKICYEILKAKQDIPIISYNSDGVFCEEFESITVAASKLGISRKCVNDCVNNKQQHAGGFIFRRKSDNYPLNIIVDKRKLQLKKKPILCLVNDVVIEYPDFESASKATGIKKATIRDAFYSGRTLRSGHYFVYKDAYKQVS